MTIPDDTTERSDPSKGPFSPNAGDSGDWSKRTNADAKSLLLELARALRGFSFYDETAPERRPLLDRAFRALVGELDRAGSIEFALGDGGFEVQGLPQPIEPGDILGPLASVLRTHRIERVRLEVGLTSTALHGFFDLLGQPSERFKDPDCFARNLEARDTRGIQLNGIVQDTAPTTPKLSTTSPRASASLATTRVVPNCGNQSLSLESHPLDMPSTNDPGERLRARLIELDRTTNDEAYARLARDITVWAEELFLHDAPDDCYRALLVLADHAVGRGGRPERQARIAATCFGQIANGDCLRDLIVRAMGATKTGVRAAQLLLQLGSSAAPAIFAQICENAGDCAQNQADQSAALGSLVLALGEHSLPTLVQAIQSNNERRAEHGIRLAGELQNPAVLPALTKALHGAPPRRRGLILRALEFLPGDESKRALAKAGGEQARQL
jgi:hypothetical protein